MSPLPANWTTGQQFTAANENTVETAVNTATTNITANTASLALLKLTPTAVKTTTYAAVAQDLVIADATSAGFTVTLPTAPADLTQIEVKKVDASANVVTVATGGSDVFNIASGATSATLVVKGHAQRYQYSASPAIWYVVNNDSPLAETDKRYAASPGSPGGFTTTATAAGTTTLDITKTATQVFTGATTQTVLLPTTSVVAGAVYTIINQSSGIVTVQSSGANTILALAGSASAPFASADFIAVVATPTTAANWAYVQNEGNAVLGTPVSGVLTNCTGGPTLTNATLVTPALGTPSSGVITSCTGSPTLTSPTLGTPASGVLTNCTGLPAQSVVGAKTLTAGVATASTTDTPLAAYTIPAGTCVAGTTFTVKVAGIQSVASGNVTFNIRIGTATTTAGSSIVAAVVPAVALSGGGFVDGLLTVRTLTSSGTCIATALGVGSTTVVSTASTTTTVDVTVQEFLSVSASASAGTFTANNVFIAPNV